MALLNISTKMSIFSVSLPHFVQPPGQCEYQVWIPNIAYCLLIVLTVLNKATLHICWFWANPHLRSPSFFCYDIWNFNFWGPSCFSGEHGHVSAGDVLPHAVWRHQHSGELPPPCGPAVAAGSHFCPLLREPLHLHHRTHGWDQPKSMS